MTDIPAGFDDGATTTIPRVPATHPDTARRAAATIIGRSTSVDDAVRLLAMAQLIPTDHPDQRTRDLIARTRHDIRATAAHGTAAPPRDIITVTCRAPHCHAAFVWRGPFPGRGRLRAALTTAGWVTAGGGLAPHGLTARCPAHHGPRP